MNVFLRRVEFCRHGRSESRGGGRSCGRCGCCCSFGPQLLVKLQERIGDDRFESEEGVGGRQEVPV